MLSGKYKTKYIYYNEGNGEISGGFSDGKIHIVIGSVNSKIINENLKQLDKRIIKSVLEQQKKVLFSRSKMRLIFIVFSDVDKKVNVGDIVVNKKFNMTDMFKVLTEIIEMFYVPNRN